jgi:hypothetical protein
MSTTPTKINMGKLWEFSSLYGLVRKIVQQATECSKKPVAFVVPEWSPIQAHRRHNIYNHLYCGWWRDHFTFKLGFSGMGRKKYGEGWNVV